MTKKLDKKDIGRSSSVFWAHGDNVLSASWGARLPYSKEDLRLILNLHALFAEKLCVVDASLLHNEPLRELIMYDHYALFLSNSVVIPMLRTSVSNFEDLEYQLRLTGKYGLLDETKARAYANFLNEKVSTILPTNDEYFTEVLTANYEHTLLNSDFLAEAGLLVVQKDLLKYVNQYQKKFGSDKVWRSIFFYFADELAKRRHPIYSARLKWISSAIWNSVFLQPFDLKPAFPHSYSEAILRMLTKGREALHLNTKHIEKDPFENIPLHLDDIRNLDANSVLEIRKTSAAKSYFEKARLVEQESVPSRAGKLLLEAEELYLASLSEQLASIVTGRRRKISSARKKLRIIKWSGVGGSIGIALVTLPFGAAPIIAPALIGTGIIWLVGASFAESKLSERQKKQTLLARQQWELMKRSQGEQRPIISVSETREGKKPPLF